MQTFHCFCRCNCCHFESKTNTRLWNYFRRVCCSKSSLRHVSALHRLSLSTRVVDGYFFILCKNTSSKFSTSIAKLKQTIWFGKQNVSRSFWFFWKHFTFTMLVFDKCPLITQSCPLEIPNVYTMLNCTSSLITVFKSKHFTFENVPGLTWYVCIRVSLHVSQFVFQGRLKRPCWNSKKASVPCRWNLKRTTETTVLYRRLLISFFRFVTNLSTSISTVEDACCLSTGACFIVFFSFQIGPKMQLSSERETCATLTKSFTLATSNISENWICWWSVRFVEMCVSWQCVPRFHWH